MPYKGLLKIDGFMNLNQFWPDGKSDADTIKILVDPQNSFTFQSASGNIKRTRAFTGAWVKYRKSKATGKKTGDPVISKQNLITVRLQGVDAPELHLPTTVTSDKKAPGKQNGSFRQKYGGRAADELGNYIARLVPPGTEKVQCHFETHVDLPTHACDSKGRFVGDVFVGLSAGGVSLNKWLVENGWAFPLFYDTMHVPETEALVKAWNQGRNRKGRPGKSWTAALLPFSELNRIRSDYKIPGYPGSDKGRVNYPKIFRRQAVFWIQTSGALSPARFYELLGKNTKKEKDYLTTYKKFKQSGGAKPKKWERLVDHVGKNGKTKFSPVDLVFKEEPSTLHTGPVKEHSARVTEW